MLSDEQRASTVTMLAEDDTRRYNETYTNNTFNIFEDPRLTSLLSSRGNNHTNLGELLQVLENYRNKYNISVKKECQLSEYCSGEFRDLILAYNNIHGYVSLLVSSKVRIKHLSKFCLFLYLIR